MQVPATISMDIVPKMQSLPNDVKEIFKRRLEHVTGGSINYESQIAVVDNVNVIRGWGSNS
mgnify:CR=1 FL=1